MSKKRFFAIFIASALMASLCPMPLAAGFFSVDPGFGSLLGGNFITRGADVCQGGSCDHATFCDDGSNDADKLYVGSDKNSPYRFMGVNWQALLANWQQTYPDWAYTIPAEREAEASWQWEIEDAVRSTAEMGGTVIRMSAFSLRTDWHGEYILTTTDSAQHQLAGADGIGHL